MALVKMKEKGQVTIPASVRKEIAAQRGDMLEVTVRDGAIILTPQDVVSRKAAKSVDITAWIGAGKGLFASAEEADAFIRAERAKWE